LFYILYYLRTISQRIARFLKHLFFSDNSIHQPIHLKLLKWLPGNVLLFVDLFALPELYDGLCNMIKGSSRSLTNREIELGKSVYGNALPYSQLKIDNKAILGPKQGHFAYVSYFTINSYGDLSDHLFIHELMHIWQYQKFGSLYIIHALFAQHSEEGYNYGGVEKLKQVKKNRGTIFQFNFEQQADIVEDYFLISRNCGPKWGNATYEDLPVYQYFLNSFLRKAI